MERKCYNLIKPIITILVFLLLYFLSPYMKIPDIFTYVFIFLLIFIFYFKEIKIDLKNFFKDFKKNSKMVIKRYLIMFLCLFIIAIFISIFLNGKVSSNQQQINNMLSKSLIPTILLSVIYAPFVEEMIFRFSFRKLIKNKTLFIIISGFVFGILHMLDKMTSFLDIIYIFQYSIIGICLSKAYTDSDNIFVSMSMHFIQNMLSVLLFLTVH